MAGISRLLLVSAAASCILMAPAQVLATRKATDMMSEALRQRASGNYAEAISGFEYALENTANATQRNLARFMLGDCQLESGRFADAARTFGELSESVNGKEEKAEALFRLMQAEAGLGNKKKVDAAFAAISENHKSSPYFELARSFVKSEGMRNGVQAAKNEKAVVVAAKTEENPSAVAEPLVAKKSEPVVAAEPEKKVDVAAIPDETEDDAEIAKASVEPPTEKAEVKPVSEETPVLPEKQTKPAVRESSSPASKVVAQNPVRTGFIKVDRETATLLSGILKVEAAQDKEKEELASKILSLQDALKDGPDKPGMDKTLLQLAETTAKFGELLEACKTYDQILTLHPTSNLVEKAYYEAIRLRAVLGVHEAVIGWSKAFLAAFPTSDYRGRIRALVEYAQARGKLDLSLAGDDLGAPKNAKSAKDGSAASLGGNDALLVDAEYVGASRKMKDGRYNLALHDFNRLSQKYPAAPQIWWDVALVQVQLEDFKQAQKAINQMLKLDPSNEDANSLAGYINYRLENFAEAASAYDKAGEPEGKGVTFFDAKTASERMKKSAGSK